MTSFGAAILIILAFCLFSFGTWAMRYTCSRIKAWDTERVDELKREAQLDVIRYALIMHKIREGKYPEKTDKGALKGMVGSVFGHDRMLDIYHVIHYEQYMSFDGPAFKLILSDTRNKRNYQITSYQVSPEN